MAEKREFLEEIDQQTSRLNAGIEQVSGIIAENTKQIANLRESRNERIRRRANKMLPSIEASIIEALNTMLPGFVTVASVTRLASAEDIRLQAQLVRLCAHFDPMSYASRKNQLEVELATTQEDDKLIQTAFDELNNIPEVERLIQDGYGTNVYPHSWWNSPQYYRDWKAADIAIDLANKERWEMLRQAYESAKSDAAISRETIQRLENGLRTLNEQHEQHEELQTARRNIPNTILEQLRIKLIAHLDCQDPVPGWMSEIGSLNTQIVDLNAQNAKLQTSRGKMSEDLAGLHAVKTRAVRSRKRDVPDEYLQSLRQGNILYNDGGSFYEGMVFGQMTEYFAEQREVERRASRDRYDDRSNGWSSSVAPDVDRTTTT